METASIRTPRMGASCGAKEKSMNIVPMTYKNKESRSSKMQTKICMSTT